MLDPYDGVLALADDAEAAAAISSPLNPRRSGELKRKLEPPLNPKVVRYSVDPAAPSFRGQMILRVPRPFTTKNWKELEEMETC